MVSSNFHGYTSVNSITTFILSRRLSRQILLMDIITSEASIKQLHSQLVSSHYHPPSCCFFVCLRFFCFSICPVDSINQSIQLMFTFEWCDFGSSEASFLTHSYNIHATGWYIYLVDLVVLCSHKHQPFTQLNSWCLDVLGMELIKDLGVSKVILTKELAAPPGFFQSM